VAFAGNSVSWDGKFNGRAGAGPFAAAIDFIFNSAYLGVCGRTLRLSITLHRVHPTEACHAFHVYRGVPSGTSFAHSL